MTIRVASRLRIILHDVSGSKPRYMSSFVVETTKLPDAFLGWIKEMAAGHFAGGKKQPPKPAIGAETSRTEKVKGQLVESRPARKKGGKRGDSKA